MNEETNWADDWLRSAEGQAAVKQTENLLEFDRRRRAEAHRMFVGMSVVPKPAEREKPSVRVPFPVDSGGAGDRHTVRIRLGRRECVIEVQSGCRLVITVGDDDITIDIDPALADNLTLADLPHHPDFLAHAESDADRDVLSLADAGPGRHARDGDPGRAADAERA